MTNKERLIKTAKKDTLKGALVGGGLGAAGLGIPLTFGGGLGGLGIGSLIALIRNSKEKDKEKRNENWRKLLATGGLIGSGLGLGASIIPPAILGASDSNKRGFKKFKSSIGF